MGGVEDVARPVGAHLEACQPNVAQGKDDVVGKLQLISGVVLEVQVGCTVQQLWPIGA